MNTQTAEISDGKQSVNPLVSQAFLSVFLFLAIVTSSPPVQAEDVTVVDRAKTRLVNEETTFVFRDDGAFFVRQETIIKVLGETKLYYVYAKGNWTRNDDRVTIQANAKGTMHCNPSDGQAFTTRGNAYKFEFRQEGKRLFRVDGVQREVQRIAADAKETVRVVESAIK